MKTLSNKQRFITCVLEKLGEYCKSHPIGIVFIELFDSEWNVDMDLNFDNETGIGVRFDWDMYDPDCVTVILWEDDRNQFASETIKIDYRQPHSKVIVDLSIQFGIMIQKYNDLKLQLKSA